MAKYKANGPSDADGYVRTEDSAHIPADPLNVDYQDVLQWIADGNTPDPWATEEEIKAMNAQKARDVQQMAVNSLANNEMRKTLSLPPTLDATEETEMTTYATDMQTHIDNPPTDPVWNPPLPPGVAPPVYDQLIIKIDRVPGWNSVLGWKCTLLDFSTGMQPTNTAMAVYNAPDCTNYLFTTGAFVWDADAQTWGATCPAGFEPGDADINFGVLYGSAPLACFTMPAGQTTMTVTAYDSGG